MRHARRQSRSRLGVVASAAAAVAAVSFASGCLRDSDAFAVKGAREACERIEACDREFFDEEYSGSHETCQDDIESNSVFTFEALEVMGCEYQPDRARACLKTARDNADACGQAATDAIDDACANVFACPAAP